MLYLRCGEETISTVELVRGCAELSVGRSHSCALRTPQDDHSVSAKHARIFWKSSNVYIEDCGSKNGIYVNGVRITKPVRLEDGGIYCIGGCRLVVSKKSGAEIRRNDRCHKIEFLNGDRAHDIVDIKPKADSTGGLFTLGLDPGNDIVLPDMLVSRRHAAFLVKRDGACWIQDLGSRNGTYVNGEKLEGKERFLHDGDKVSIAYFDFRFLHKDVSHTRAHLWTKLGVLAVLAIIITTGVVIREFIVKPPSRIYRDQAFRYAAEENFSSAYVAVTNAVNARNGETERMQNESLAAQLNAWSSTYDGWKVAMGHLSAGRFVEARVKIGELMSDPGNWTWNTSTAVSMRRDAEFAGNLIRRLHNAADTMKHQGLEVRDRVAEGIKEIDRYLSENERGFKGKDYLAPAIEALAQLRARMSALSSGFSRIDNSLSKIDRVNPDFTQAVEVLEKVSVSAKLSTGVREYARSLLPVCKSFLETQSFLRREFAAVTDMDFVEVNRMRTSLPLPEKNDCIRFTLFSDARDAFIAKHESYQMEASLLAPMVRNMNEAGIRNGSTGSLLDFVTSSQSWDKALGFDCFAGRFPESSRHDPNSVYDELCGIECTYENLRKLPKAPGRQTDVRMKFIPKTQKARMIFGQIKTFIGVLDRPEGRQFQTGRLGELYATSMKISEMRDSLVSQLKARCEKGLSKGSRLTRERIVAGFFAEYFSDEPSYADLRALETSFKTLERQMNALNEKYDTESDPEKRLAIRKEILSKGIPGGESVRKRWVESME